MNPKFTLITHDYPPAHGGVARYLSSLVKASKGRIEVLVPLDQATPFEKGVIEGGIKHVNFWSSLWPHWLPLIKRCLEVDENQIILVSHVFPIGTAAFIANALGGPEYLVIFHGTDLKRVKNRWKRWFLRRICVNARLLIANSNATKKMLTRLVPGSNPLILTPGLEPFGLPSKTESRNQFKISPETKVILAVSRLVERKGIDTLIQACTGINSEFLLVVVGNGEYAEPLHKLAELSGVNVRWIKDCDDQTLYSWYAAADMFCLPGREVGDDVEGFGMVFLEAAYAGLPVIAGDSGGAKEAVLHDKTGLLIQPTVEACAKAIAKLIDDPELANRLGQSGRDRAIADFNWSDRWNKLSRILQTSNCKEFNESDSRKNELDSGSYTDVKPDAQDLDISVVIPCYNHAKEIKDTLESLANQTVTIKQVIVVDDGSDDNPAQIAEQFKQILPLTLEYLTTNQGAPKARNVGFSKVTGEYVIFLDADIKLHRTAIEKLYSALISRHEASYAYCDFLWGKHLFRGKPFNPEDLKKQNYIHTSALIRTKDFEHFDESLKKFQDWDLWLTMLQSGKQGVWVPETLMKIKERKNGISSWLPSFVFKIPWPILGFTPKAVTKYREAERIIREKHQLL